ncbi:MAG: glycerol-3-phosphate 1-O-acyltransferase PlsB [Pseudomonadales bacterium]|nr:glycerol-3-phosphate 1-O-acyltransferase PlsB [Pseudomonadales bacterium]
MAASPEPQHAGSLMTRLRRRQFNLNRRVLFSWIRPTVLGCDAENTGIADDDIVCYVLPFRSVADLMVIDKACQAAGLPRPVEPMQWIDEQRAIFFLGHPEGLWGRRTLRKQSARMSRLFFHQDEQDRKVKIVPVSLFWGHQPNKEKSLLGNLLSDDWTVTSRFRKFLAILFHPNHILVQFSRAIDLSTLMAEEADREKQIRRLLRLLRVHFTQQKQAILGPDLSHRRTLINSILESQAVVQAIEKEARSKQTTTATIEAKALSYANEIVSHQSYAVIRFFHVVLTWLWNKLYDGIEVNHIQTVKDLAQNHEIIYVPCHRSHIDYLLLSYVLYHNGLTPPHIAAGKNLNLPVVGSLLRRAGAFFMRRTFQGDNLYKSVFDEYLHLMFVRGYSVEYFIEGGRSRTGRTLNPRTGMLSMTMRSFQRNASKPICFMPVYFGYERIMEDATYLNELSGAAKKEESLFDIFRVLGSLKNAFGQVSVNFGEPLQLAPFLDQHLPDWRTPEQTESAAFSQACSELAVALGKRINGAVAVNPVNLVATILLCTPRQNIGKVRLLQQVASLQSIASGLGFSRHMTVTRLTPEEIIAEAVSVSGIVAGTESFGEIYTAPAPLPVLLTYYRNNTLHVFLIPALVARLVRQSGIAREDVQRICRGLYPYLQAECFVHWPLEDLPALVDQTISVLAANNLIEEQGNLLQPPGRTTPEYINLTAIAEIVEPTLERYFIVTRLLEEQPKQSIRELETNAAAIGQQLSTFYGINAPEFFDKSVFATFINALREEGIVNVRHNQFELVHGFAELEHFAQVTMDEDLRLHVIQAIHEQLDQSAVLPQASDTV